MDKTVPQIVVDCFDIYSAILRSQAASLHSHVTLHEWLAFYSLFLNIHQSGVLTVLTICFLSCEDIKQNGINEHWDFRNDQKMEVQLGSHSELDCLFASGFNSLSLRLCFAQLLKRNSVFNKALFCTALFLIRLCFAHLLKRNSVFNKALFCTAVKEKLCF